MFPNPVLQSDAVNWACSWQTLSSFYGSPSLCFILFCWYSFSMLLWHSWLN